MKVIFLDIDGVLNTSETSKEIYYEYQSTHKRRVELDVERIKYLKEIVDTTSAVIVLSSTWRSMGHMEDGVFIPNNRKTEELVKLLSFNGLFIYDVTPFMEGDRFVEIMTWIQEHEVEDFIIIDDESFGFDEEAKKHLVKTINMRKNLDDILGLSEHHVPDAIQKLTLKSKKLS